MRLPLSSPLLALAVLSGCAFTDGRLTLPDKVSSVSAAGGLGRTVVIVAPFADVRAHPNRCGMQKNGYNMDTADAICDRDPAEWIATVLARQLTAAGFHVVATSSEADAASLQVQGELVQFFVEPVIGFWTGSLEADLAVRLVAESADGLLAERRFFAKGVRGGQLFSVRGAYQLALERATDEIVSEMVLAILELADKYQGAVSDATSH